MNLSSVFLGSDFPFFFANVVNYLSSFPLLWSNTAGNGFGQNISFILGLNSFFIFLIKPFTEIIGFNWYLVEKVVFIIPYFLISFTSAYIFASLFLKSKSLKLISSLIFATNTYALMIMGGGQFGVVIAYAFAPLVMYFLIKEVDSKDRKLISNNLLISILVLAFQTLIDPRLALITLAAVIVYFFVNLILKIVKVKRVINLFLIIFFALLINSFWIIPFIFSRDLNLSTAYTSSDIASFFSFAKLEDAIALLHPYYPENIFGKIGFLKPEYLFFTLLAFSSLLFISKKNKIESGKILSLIVIAITGIFLAKGTNFPLGSAYTLFLDKVPFATIYRDPMKFYLLIGLSFSILIPWSANKFGDYFYKKFNFKNTKPIFLIIFVAIWFVSIRYLFVLSPMGVFNPIKPDNEYFKFAKEFEDKEGFSRIFSIPTKQRFLYSSQLNPVINANDYYDEYDNKDLITIISDENFAVEMRKLSVEYIVLPYDQESTIFLIDRKFNQELYDKYYLALSQREDLEEDKNYTKLKVFRVGNHRNLIWSSDEEIDIQYEYENTTLYKFTIQNISKPSEIIFNQSYSPNWVLISEKGEEKAAKKFGKFNKFKINEDGEYKIYYKSQKLVNIGLIVSLLSLSIIIILLVKKWRKW